jgi:hypothetical protein
VQRSPALLSKFIDYEGFILLNLNKGFLLYILGKVLEDFEKSLLVLLLDFLQHLLAFSVKISPNIEGLKLVIFILLVFCFFDFCNTVHIGLLYTEDIVKISLVNVDIFILFIRFYLLK